MATLTVDEEVDPLLLVAVAMIIIIDVAASAVGVIQWEIMTIVTTITAPLRDITITREGTIMITTSGAVAGGKEPRTGRSRKKEEKRKAECNERCQSRRRVATRFEPSNTLACFPLSSALLHSASFSPLTID